MGKRLAAAAVGTGTCARALRSLMAAIAFAASLTPLAHADAARGLAWLQAQVQPGGTLAVDSRIASAQQARCETASTLIKLAPGDSNIPALVASLQGTDADVSTESLACWQQSRQVTGQDVSTADLEARRINSQGYAPILGYGNPTPLDSAWAFGVQLQDLAAGDKAGALAWLQALQAADGSFAVNGVPDLLTTAVIVRALKSEASRNPIAAAVATAAATYLLARRNAQGNWASDLATTAVAFEAVEPYLGSNTSISTGIGAYLLAQQQLDGSWAGDPYVTAVALRALALVSAIPLNPAQSGLKVAFIDEKTSLPLSGVNLQASGASTFSATSNTSGVTQVTGVAPGSYQFSASLGSYAPLTINLTLQAGQISDLGTLEFLPVGSSPVITGTVKDQSTGAALAGVTITATNPNGAAFTGTTGSDGRFRMANVALTPGETDHRLSMRASVSGYADATGVVLAYNGQVSDFSPVLAPLTAGVCNVSGTIVNGFTLQPVTGVTVKATVGSSTFVGSTDAAGKYTVAVSPGAVPNFRVLTTLQTTLTGYDSVTATASLICPSNKITTVDFSPRIYPAGQSPANANTASLRGVLVDADTNQPIAGGQIVATPNVGTTKTIVSASDGSFTVAGMIGSLVSLTPQVAGYESPTLTYSLTPLQTLDISQVRLRVFAASQLLPDLKVTAVRRGTVQGDPQTLGAEGTISVDVKNTGTSASPAGLALYAFSDLNVNKAFDGSTDPVLGQSTIGSSLAPGQATTVQVAISGVLPFRDAPISVVIDPANSIAEISKTNNVGSTSDQDLVTYPAFNSQQVALKWAWNDNGCTDKTSGSSVCSPNVMMTPAVGPLHDTNGDGKIDDKDTPRVVFTTYTGTRYLVADTVLRVADGASGALVWSKKLGTASLHSQTGIALADLDGDGIPEIIGVKFAGGAVVVDSQTGNVKWQTSEGNTPLAVSVADVDGDGRPEVLVGSSVYNWNGTLKFTLSGCTGGSSSVAVKFINGSSGQQILCGSSAYSSTGQLLWGGPAPGSAAGPPASASFDHGISSNFAWVFGGTVYMLNSQGSVLWSASTGGGAGGTPVIADLDGDGIPEIIVSTSNRTTAFRADGSVLWAQTTLDPSQGTTSTAFDFAGDGHMYVVYRDATKLHIFDGPSGNEVYTRPSNSFTGAEGPVIADVDGDGHADVIVPGDSSQVTAPSQQGIYVYQSSANGWAPTRKVWNQYHYTIGAINDDLSVPRSPTPNWQSYNRFLSNTRTGGDPRAIPDLTVGYLRVADGGAGTSTLTVRAGNAGGYKLASGTKFALYNVDPALGTPAATAFKGAAVLGQELQPGQSSDVTFSVSGPLSGLTETGTIWIVGDDDGQGVHALQDFDRTNNAISGNLAAIATNIRVTASTDKQQYTNQDLALFTALLSNQGSFAQQLQVRFTIVDTAGNAVQVLALPPLASVMPGVNGAVQLPWAASGVLSGDYRVLAELVAPDGLVYGSSTASFTISTTAPQAAATRIAADRVNYNNGQFVQLTTASINPSSNSTLDALLATTTVTKAAQIVFTKSEAIGQIAPGGQRQYGYAFVPGTAGDYVASIALANAQGTIVSQSSTQFSVFDASQTAVGLKAQVQAPPTANIGQPLPVSVTATNTGSGSLTNVAVTIRAIEPLSGQALGSTTQTIPSWSPGASIPLQWTWIAQGADAQLIVFSASINTANGESGIGQANVRLIGTPKLAVSPELLTFPATYVGEISNAQTVTVTSSGSANAGPITAVLGGMDPTQFVITQNACDQRSIAPGASCNLTVAYQPTQLTQQLVPHAAQVTVQYPSGIDLVVPLTGQPKPIVLAAALVLPGQVVLGQDLAIGWSVTNPAAAATSAALTLSVLDASGQTIASWPLTTSLAANGTQSGSQTFTTNGQPQVLNVVLTQDVPGGAKAILAQGPVPLVGVPLLATQSQVNFGPIYPGEAASQTITITSTGQVAATALTFTLSGQDPSQFLIRSGGCTQLNSLPVGATCQVTLGYQPSQAASHAAQLHVGYANTNDLVVNLAGQAKPVVFSGTAASDSTQVEAGTPVGLTYSITNPAAAIAPFTGTLKVANASSQTLGSWNINASVAANATYAGNQSFTTPVDPQALTFTLSQQVGTSTFVLSSSGFNVIDPPIQVGTSAGTKGQARVLVLVSCPPGLGAADDTACVQARSNAIASYFAAVGIQNKVVNTGDDFAAQMRCGSYNTYWISGGANKLSVQTAEELREAIWRGESLWTDGVHDSRNSILYPAQGVTQVGSLPASNQVETFMDTGMYGSGSLITLGQVTKFAMTTGLAQAEFAQVPGQQSPVPAVVSNAYGNGNSLVFAFDLAAMMTSDPSAVGAALANFVAASANYSAEATPTLTSGDVTLLETHVSNQSTRTATLKVTATLPAGLASISATSDVQLTANTDGSTQATWTYSSPAGSTQPIDWQIRAVQPGTYSVPYQVYSLPLQGSVAAPKLRSTATIDLVVRDATSLVQAAQTQVNALQPTASNDKTNKTKAQSAVSLAAANYGQGNYEAAIAQWIAAADALQAIASVDVGPARNAVSLALEATTDAACIQKCGNASCQ